VGISDPDEDAMPPVDFVEEGKGKGKARINANARPGLHERRVGHGLEVPDANALGVPAAANKAKPHDSGVGTLSGEDDLDTSHDADSEPSSRWPSPGPHLPYPDGTALTEYNLELLRAHAPAQRSYEGYFSPNMTETTGAQWILGPVNTQIVRRNSKRIVVTSDAHGATENRMPPGEGENLNSNALDEEGDVKDAPGRYPWYDRMYMWHMRMRPPVYENRGEKKNKHKGKPMLGY
jgi:hypothetical protein